MQTIARNFRSCLLLLIALCLSAVTAAAQSANEKPELVLQTGHTETVKAAVFSKDGKWLASGSTDNTVKIWDLGNSRELRTLRGHANYVNALSLSPDNTILASGGNDRQVKLWNPNNGNELRTLSGHAGPVQALAFSASGKLLASGATDKQVKIWDATNGNAALAITGHNAAVTALAFSGDEKLLATGDAAGTVKVWNTATGGDTGLLVNLRGKKINAVTFSPDGKVLAASGADGSIKAWRLGQPGDVFLETTGVPALTLRYAPDGVLYWGRSDGQVKAWNAATAKVTVIADAGIKDGPTSTLNLFAFNDDASWVAVGIGDRNITVRPIAQPAHSKQLTNRSSVLLATAFSPDGRWFASGTNENAVRLWDVKTGREVAKLTEHAGYVTSLAFSPGGGFLAAGSQSSMVKVWDLENGNRQILNLTGHEDYVGAVAFSPDAKLLATGSGDATIKLWNLADGSLSQTLQGHAGEVLGVAFNADGKWLASASADQTVKLWDTGNLAAPPRALHSNTGLARAVAFSPDGNFLAAATDKQLQVWRAPFDAPAQSFPQTQAVYSLSFSRDNRTLAAGGFGRDLRLYDVSQNKEKATLKGHTATINGVAFSPDPRWLISASADGSMIVWDAEQAKAAATLVSCYQNDDWIVVAPDGLFDGSPAAWQQILWRFRGDTFTVAPVEIFFSDYFHPGLLAEILGNKNPKAAQNLNQKDRRQPTVKLAQNVTAAHAQDPRLMRLALQVSEAPPDAANSTSSGATDLRLFRNGVLIKIWRGSLLQGQKERTIEVTVPIVAGPNVFTAYAFNRDNVKSADASLAVTGAATLRRKGVAHVIAIGINEYANPEFNLKLAGADADSVIKAVAKAQERLEQFERFEVTPLLDKDATKANILAAMRRLSDPAAPLPPNAPAALAAIKQAQPEDAVVIFYAGHGMAEKDRWYLLPHDLGYMGPRGKADAKAQQIVIRNSISDLEIESAVEGLDARGILLILDACNSGQALESEEKRRGPMNSRGLAQLAYEKGMYLLAAAEGYQLALESKKLGHGYLTYTLVEEGLQGMADTSPKDGVTLAQEWLRFAAKRVPELQLERENQMAGKPTPPTVSREFGLGGPQKPTPAPQKLPRVRDVQRPRLFYRPELEKARLIVARQ